MHIFQNDILVEEINNIKTDQLLPLAEISKNLKPSFEILLNNI